MPFIPLQLLPDEAVYSYVTRFHQVSGHYRVSDTLTQFFGQNRLKLNPLIPNHLSIVSTLARIHAELLLKEHTAFPLIACFLDSMQAQRLHDYLLGSESKRSWALSSILACHIPVHLTWKYCPLCLEDDSNRYGVGYWHLSHQLLGVTSCPVHQIMLIAPFRHVGLPRKFVLPSCESVELLPAGTSDHGLSRFIVELAQLAKNQSHPVLKEAYLPHLQARDLLTPAGNLRATQLKAELTEFWKNAAIFQPMQYCFEPNSLRQLVTATHSSNYLRHILLMNYFAATPELFFNPGYTVRHVFTEPDTAQTNHTPALVDEMLRAMQNGKSLRSIAAEHGVSIGFLQKTASHHSIATNHRPSKVLPKVRQRAVNLAIACIHRETIAERLSISVSAVEAIIASIPDLSMWRRRMQFVERQKANREEFQQAIADLTEATGITEFKRKNYRCYMWLYKNDKEWLDEIVEVSGSKFK